MVRRIVPRLVLAALWFVTPAAARAQDAAIPDSAASPASPIAPELPTLEPPVVPVIPSAPDFPRGRISGYGFGDLYYNLEGDPRHAYAPSGADSGRAAIDNSGKPITRDLNGLAIRRIYFQLDNDLTIRVATRLRLEIDGKSLTSDGKIGVNVKSAYVQVRSVIPRGDFQVGMLSTPTWETAEEFWQYRSIEKTVGDFRGFASATDMGVLLKGFVDGEHRVGYAAAVANGTGQSPENNRYKKFYLSLPMRAGDLRFDPYVDYEDAAGNLDRTTYRLFAGYELRRMAAGVEWYDRVNHRAGIPNQEPCAWSIFTRAAVHPLFAVFVRLDDYRPDRRAANRVDSRMWIAGVDWQPVKDVHFMPNVESMQYRARGTAIAPSHHDLQARITFYYRFSRPQS